MIQRYGSLVVGTIIVLIGLWGMGLVDAQTPAPIPTKTLTPTPVPVESTPTDNESSQVLFEPFTQSDLSVLTGNVQRPNGAVWFEDELYVACNGDWTLYQLDSTIGTTETYIYGIRNAHMMVAEGNGEAADINLWIPDFEANAFMFVNRSRAPQVVAGNLQNPWGVAAVGEEGFLVTNLSGNNVMRIDRGGATEVLIQDLRSPTGIAADGEYVYVANNGSARRSMEWITQEDLLSGSGVMRPLVSGLQNTTGLVLAPDGYLYFAYAIGTRGVVGRVQPGQCREGCTNEQVEIVVYTELAAPLAGLTISQDMRLFMHTIFRPEIYWVQLPG